MKRKRVIYVFAFSITLIIALSFLAFASPETSIGNTTISGYEKAFDPGGMNLSVKPGDDFYEYVNGAWIKSHPVPADKSRYGEFLIVDDRNL
jgi:putative endopeptidase